MAEFFKNLDWSVLTGLVLSILPTVICLTLHEYSHARVALALGDTTARDQGRLTLNPLKSFDLMGFFMMALAGFGWAKPVPIDMRRFKNPKRGMAITALAGPVSNFVIALVALFLYGILLGLIGSDQEGIGYYAIYMVWRTAYLSTSFAVFNIIPIPPLDGSKVVFALISDKAYFKLMRYERYGMLLLFALVFTGIINKPLTAAVNFLFDKLLWAARLGLAITGKT